MELPNLPNEGLPALQPDRLEVQVDEVEDVPFRHLGKTTLEPHLLRNDEDLGIIDCWVVGSSQTATIEGMYPADGRETILDTQAWQAVAIYMHGLEAYRGLRRIDFPGGQQVFLDVI